MTRGTRSLFAVTTVALTLTVLLGLLLACDVYLHHRYAKVAGLNIHGYRGPLATRKQPGERRIAVLGGSTALGYGLRWEESFPAVLERRLNEARSRAGEGRVSVVNLAGNSEGAYAYKYNLRYYERLGYDLALFYTGYNDLKDVNRKVNRNESAVFRLTGYMPIFPLIFKEKAMALRYGGDIEAAYRQRPTVFRPTLAQQVGAGALEAATRVSHSLDQQLGRLTRIPSDEEFARGAVGCGAPWTFYCEQMSIAVAWALERGTWVVVVTEPYKSDGHVEQQQAMVGMLREEFAGHPRLRYINMGRAVNLEDRSLSYDSLHLTAAGNERIADRLVPTVLEVLTAMEAEP